MKAHSRAEYSSFLSLALLHRHSRNHEHDTVKAFSLFVIILGDLLKHMVAISGVSRDRLATASLGIFGVTTFIQVSVYSVYLLRDLLSNDRPLRENREEWLLTASKVPIIIGVLCYNTGNKLPGYLMDFSNELHCNERCVRRGQIAGVVLLIIALITFKFIPEIFRKINTEINENFDMHFIRGEEFEEYRMQWFMLRMTALMLDFDTVYTSVWIYTFVDFENCDLDDIIGSSACILTGWFTWTAYAITYTCYLTDPASIVQHFKAYKLLHTRYRVVNMLYYTAAVLFLTTFFPVHVLADNVEPLSCGCAAATSNNSMTIFTCNDRLGVLETRLGFLLYQVMVLAALGCLGVIKYSLQVTEYSKLRQRRSEAEDFGTGTAEESHSLLAVTRSVT